MRSLPLPPSVSRRQFLAGTAAVAAGLASRGASRAQSAGERPARAPEVSVLNPRDRVPVGLIIDDSTCLVNLNRFAMPQFDAAFEHAAAVYRRNWRDWPIEIPDSFVRKFGEWCAGEGVKGKYSVVPYPACVGRLDRGLPGWTPKELADSLELLRTVMAPNWDFHPEMVTHTRVIDLRTGHPLPGISTRTMENWEWTTGRSADELAAYQAYALRILKEAGIPCEGLTTPGGYGGKALPQLSEASLQSVRDVFGAEIPHYFRHLYDSGEESVAPRVELASGLDGPDPRCVVSIIGCTGDWTGGWDNTEPGGADKFITADGKRGRMVDVIQRGEPAMMLTHWTGIYFNGEETGFRVFQEVVRRLKARFDHLHWMKLSELARYWAARELTALAPTAGEIALQAPFACPDFTLQFRGRPPAPPRIQVGGEIRPLREAGHRRQLASNTWHRADEEITVCFDLAKGASRLVFG
ncbi:MAG: hypothetical protein KIT22_05230 [Verrucomicrobiae bacterium]|nr:hypothetical protein [Verrucomicrobiae bacterium]